MQPMPKIEQNGPDFKYIVTYVRADIPDAQPMVTTVQQPDAWHYVVPQTNLGVYVPYRITVKAANSRGDSSAPLNPVIGYTGEDGKSYLNCELQIHYGTQAVRCNHITAQQRYTQCYIANVSCQ
jgi:hypothetical protein